MTDQTALQIFIWILISVDYKTGKMISGRFWASKELQIKPRTFHKALTERLQDRYKLVTLSSDNKNTTILVNNWHKFQQASDTSSDSSVTTKGQQSDTKQEYKEIKEVKNRSLTDNLDIPKIERVAKSQKISVKEVLYYKENYIGWIKEKPSDKKRQGRNMSATVQNWIRRDIRNGELKQIKSFVELAEEETGVKIL